MGGTVSVKLAFAFFGVLAATSALGAYPEDDEPSGLAQIKLQIEDDRAAEAETSLRQMLTEDPKNPDILNLLGYASRKLGRLRASREFYSHALAIDPVHKGALEYLGELELETGDVASAKELLRRLSEQCPAGCEELDDLLLTFTKNGVATSIGGN